MAERRSRAEIPADLAGQRFDRILPALFPGHSRARLAAEVRAGRIRLDGREVQPRTRVHGGEEVAWARIEAPVLGDRPEAIGLDIVFEDADLLVIDKPAGLVVHPGAGNASHTLQNALLALDPKLAIVPRAGLVHRLDKDTSGLLVIARTLEAHTALVRALETHDVEREYEAICVGVMTAGGTVDAPLGRHPVDRLKQAVREDGRESVTHYRVIHRYRGHTHVRLNLETGRTHQIRVHMAHIRYPLVGDKVYGGRLLLPKAASPQLIDALRGFNRQALHAARLAFEHPVSGKPVEALAPTPADMTALLGVLADDAAQATLTSPGQRGKGK